MCTGKRRRKRDAIIKHREEREDTRGKHKSVSAARDVSSVIFDEKGFSVYLRISKNKILILRVHSYQTEDH